MALLRVDPGLIIWLWITFGIVLLILRLTVWGKITGALDNRSGKIAADLDSARQAGEKATAVLAEYDQKIREGRAVGVPSYLPEEDLSEGFAFGNLHGKSCFKPALWRRFQGGMSRSGGLAAGRQ